MPLDDIITEVNAESGPEQPGDARSTSDATARRAVPSTRSPVHDPREHYDMLHAKANVDRENMSYFSTVFSVFAGVIRLL